MGLWGRVLGEGIMNVRGIGLAVVLFIAVLILFTPVGVAIKNALFPPPPHAYGIIRLEIVDENGNIVDVLEAGPPPEPFSLVPLPIPWLGVTVTGAGKTGQVKFNHTLRYRPGVDLTIAKPSGDIVSWWVEVTYSAKGRVLVDNVEKLSRTIQGTKRIEAISFTTSGDNLHVKAYFSDTLDFSVKDDIYVFAGPNKKAVLDLSFTQGVIVVKAKLINGQIVTLDSKTFTAAGSFQVEFTINVSGGTIINVQGFFEPLEEVTTP